MGEEGTWSELPKHLREEVVARVPLEYLCRFRLVCKQWHALISSTKFITTKWAEASPNRKPWLVVGPDVQYRLLAYCFFTRTWKKTSGVFLSNLLQQCTSRSARIYCGGSASGLFLVNITDPSTASEVFTVCNPLTKTSLKLEPMSSIWCTFLTGIVGGKGPDSLLTYKVVTVGMGNLGQGNPLIVEIYDSADKAWRVAGHLPGDVVIRGRGVVFCHGSFYFLTFKSGGFSIMGFNMGEGTFISGPFLPEMDKFKNQTSPQLLTCGSRILVTWGILKDGGNLRGKILQEVAIWEFEKVNVDSSSSSSSSFSWKEIAKMPSSMCEDLNRNFPLHQINSLSKCVAVGDCVCFILYKVTEVMEVVVYNLSEKQWSWLPSCSLGGDNAMARQAAYATVMAFEPRPDIKVE